MLLYLLKGQPRCAFRLSYKLCYPEVTSFFSLLTKQAFFFSPPGMGKMFQHTPDRIQGVVRRCTPDTSNLR